MLKKIKEFQKHLILEEKTTATVDKYVHDVTAFVKWLDGRRMSKAAVQEYKQWIKTDYKVKSVNSILSSLNAFFRWINHPEYSVKSIKIQRSNFIEPNKDLTKEEYEALIQTAYEKKKIRLCLLIQTICATGIRVSEVVFITVEAVKKGFASIQCKGKNRVVFIPDNLCEMLMIYTSEKNIKNGPIFLTSNGRPLNRSNIWAEMKCLCEKAGVQSSKVFPHNLRHLFGKTYYTTYQDIVRLADILGHTNINTTRIYTAESGEIHRSRIQELNLVRNIYAEDTR